MTQDPQPDAPQGAAYTTGVKPPDQTSTAKPPTEPKASSLEVEDGEAGRIDDRTIEKTPSPKG